MSIGGVRVTIATQNLFSPSSPHTELSHLQHASPSSVMRGPREELVCANSVAQSLCVAEILGHLPSLIMHQSPSWLCCRFLGTATHAKALPHAYLHTSSAVSTWDPKQHYLCHWKSDSLLKKKKSFPNSVLKAPYRLDITKRC